MLDYLYLQRVCCAYSKYVDAKDVRPAIVELALYICHKSHMCAKKSYICTRESRLQKQNKKIYDNSQNKKCMIVISGIISDIMC